MRHTPEPWTEHTIVRFEDMPHVRACVNGCAGLNPAAFRAVVEALIWALKTIDALSVTYEIPHNSSDPSNTDWDKAFTAKQSLTHALDT